MTETRYGLNSGYLSAGGLTVDPTPQVLSRSTRLANGALVKDIYAVKRSWKFTYTDLPGATANVQDGGFGRNDLLGLFNGGGVQTLVVPVEGDSTESVSVLFGDTWTEERTIILPFWRWNVEYTLEEI
ncbi:MAG: hypothetical protein ABSF99_01130 [Anaerolineales bacterium]|jgi:hypothetical protein